MNRIRELRKESSLTMKELGEKIGVTESAISLYETFKREPDLSTIVKLAEFFKVSTDFLLCRDLIEEHERILGWQNTKKESITPIEEDMLSAFRAIGKKYGKETQQAAITMLENMAGIKK